MAKVPPTLFVTLRPKITFVNEKLKTLFLLKRAVSLLQSDLLRLPDDQKITDLCFVGDNRLLTKG